MSGEGTHFLDTSALLALMKRGLTTEPGALISSFVLAELATGVALNPHPEREKARVRRAIGGAELVLPTLRTATIYGQLAAKLQPARWQIAAGAPRGEGMIPVNDLWIAALAVERGLPLYALDGHFARVEGLKFYACATSKEALHAVIQNSSDAHHLLIRHRELEPIIIQMKRVPRRQALKAQTPEGVSLGESNIRLTSLSSHPGSAFYGIHIEDALAVLCLACWDATLSQTVWDSAEGSFFQFEELFRSLNYRLDVSYRSQDPPTPPWLSCVLLPPTGGRTQTTEVRGLVITYAPCAAWALMDLGQEVIAPQS